MAFKELIEEYKVRKAEYEAIPITDSVRKHQSLMELIRIDNQIKDLERSIVTRSTPYGNYPGIMSPFRVWRFWIDPIKAGYIMLAFFTLAFLAVGIYYATKLG